jgi:hypothetical protein
MEAKPVIYFWGNWSWVMLSQKYSRGAAIYRFMLIFVDQICITALIITPEYNISLYRSRPVKNMIFFFHEFSLVLCCARL